MGSGHTPEAAELLNVLRFSTGATRLGLYALMALGLAYFAFNRALPLTIRSVFHPLLGERIHGPIGNAIDILAAVATLFGLATSLGLGAQQVNAGLDYLFYRSRQYATDYSDCSNYANGHPRSLGLDRGIRRLSELNMILAIFLLLFVFLAGPSFHLPDALLQNVGTYLSNF